MQRKNNLLKSSRNGIALVMAIMVIVIMATIMALSMSLMSKTAKKATDSYLYEQSVLLSKSATEYALLRIAQDGPCTHLNDLSFTQDTFYNIDISLRYVYTAIPAGCPAAPATIIVTTPEQNGSVIMDVAVSVTDSTVTSEPIRYFRRTIQKL